MWGECWGTSTPTLSHIPPKNELQDCSDTKAAPTYGYTPFHKPNSLAVLTASLTASLDGDLNPK